jgi:hypothetical protein
MHGSRQRLRPFRIIALAAMLATACTFANSFDEVKPLSDGTYAPAASPAPPSTTDGAPSTGPDGQTPVNPAGLIALSGLVDADGARTPVLAVLDPATGHEVGERVEMVVSGIRYDGIRDIWFVLESKGSEFQAAPNDPMVLHARSFDVATGKWTELGSIPVPPLHSYTSLVVVRDRLLYVAHVPEGGTSVQLVTVNTASPASMSVVSTQSLDKTPRGMTATRNTGSQPGGVVSLIQLGAGAEGCEAGQCTEVVRVRVATDAPAIDPPVAFGPAGAAGPVPSYASFERLERQVVVLPRTATGPTAESTALLFEPRNQELDGPGKTFVLTDSLLRGAAVSECARQLFIVGGNGDLNVHSIPILVNGAGTPAKLPTGHSGQSVYFEPTSKTVLTPFSQGSGFELAGYVLGGTPEAPTLTKRTTADWNPPTDLRPILLAVRERFPVVCP